MSPVAPSSDRPVTPSNLSGRPAGDSDLQERVRSLRLSQIPQGTSYTRQILAVVFGAGLLVVCGYLVVQALNSAGKTLTAQNEASQSKPIERTALKPPADSTSSSPSTSSSAAPAVPQGEIALEAKGYIIPAHQILVSPKVAGMIEDLDVEEGKRVRAGAVLAVLESKDYQYDLERAVAMEESAAARHREMSSRMQDSKLEIDQAQAELGEAEEQRNQLELEWKRTGKLRQSGAITAQQFEEIDGKYKAAEKRVERLRIGFELMKTVARQERVDAALADWNQAKAEVRKAQWRLDNCRIVAPIDGTILRKNAEKGNIVNPIAFNGSYSICEMADLSDLEVELNIQERDISAVHVGQNCNIRSDAFPGRNYQGVVSRLMPIADRAKGAIPVRVKLSIPAEEEGVYLKPEMGAIVTFLKTDAPAPEQPAAAEVPSEPALPSENSSAFPPDPPSAEGTSEESPPTDPQTAPPPAAGSPVEAGSSMP